MHRPLRVLTLIDRASRFGGAERLAVNVVLGLDRSRFEPSLCTTRVPRPGASATDEVREAGIPVLELDRRTRRDVLAWRRLYAHLRRERIDVLHAHKFGSNVWAAVLGPLARVPVVLSHEHTWSYEGQPLRKLADREVVARGSTRFLAVSSEDRRRMIEIERIDPGRVLVVPNGIPPLPAPSGADVRAELGIPPDAPVVGTVSQLRPQKALEVLVDAAELLRAEFPGVRVLIAGRGPEEERLRSLVRDRGLEGVVQLLGPRSDVPDLLRVFDVAVSPSDFEGSPLSVMEYMAAGLPVVATRVGGVPDLIDDGVHGFLVERRDAAALASRTAELLRSPELRRELGARAAERQRAEFDLAATVRRIEDLYEQLFAETARARAEGWSRG